ncbi:hypothetical protein HPG69_003618 [Diceros bicornis minor]|uniref:Uncharacterized protein n=1 Tax=Diceros bicornis minor TaxID=77932 RepID=A0A7J7EYK3_DICBM|nr:hypothetical protein HPG69_003618 [Diceros bicornis minor]
MPPRHPAGQGPVATASRARDRGQLGFLLPTEDLASRSGKRKFPPVAASWSQATTLHHALLCLGPMAASRL